ncbi:MAG TPA: DUF3131 domain-containing protein [Patescibacteria group bacterium]
MNVIAGAPVEPSPQLFFTPSDPASRITRFTADTWNSLKTLIEPSTGLIRDRIVVTDDGSYEFNHRTSPTNIGLFLAAVKAARDLGLVTETEADGYIKQVLSTLTKLKRYRGLYYNWYQTADGLLESRQPFISTVDNAWLLAGLITLKNAFPVYAKNVDRIINKVDFTLLYDFSDNLFYGGCDPKDGSLTPWHYGLLNSEARIASYVGINYFNVPSQHLRQLSYYSSLKGEPPYPSWGGSMFETFMPVLFVPENRDDGWQQIHRYHIKKQIEAGSVNKGFWGYSPCDDTDGIYKEFGVKSLALKPEGYNFSSTVTPHAIFLALPYEPQAALDTLFRIQDYYPQSYLPGLGFADSVNVLTGRVSKSRLALDKSMIFLSLYNHQTDNRLHSFFGSKLLTSIIPS